MTARPALSQVVLGTMGLSGFSQADADRVIHCAIDHGMTSLDTAPLYGAGRCEELVGKAIAAHRSRVQVLTKCGIRWNAKHGAAMFQMPVDGQLRWVRKDSRPSSIRQGIEESLRRLGVESIDLMQVHHLDYETRLEDSLEELERALDAGWIRAIGVSNFPRDELARANDLLRAGLSAVQDEFNALSTTRSEPLLEFCQNMDIAFLAYSPLASGVLAGKYLETAPARAYQPGDAYYLARDNLNKLNSVLRHVAVPAAEDRKATLSQLFLAWTLAQPGVTNVVAGATREHQVIENSLADSLEVPSHFLNGITQAIAAAEFEASPKPTLKTRWQYQLARARQLGGRIRRRLSPR